MALASTVTLIFSTSGIAKQRDFSKVKVAAASPSGAVIFTAPFAPSQYAIFLSKLDPLTNFTLGEVIVPIDSYKSLKTANGTEALVIQSLKPGRYVVRMVTVQEYFGGCLSKQTTSFEIAAGRVSYLGRFLPYETLASIQRTLLSTGQTTSFGRIIQIVDDGLIGPKFDLAGGLPLESIVADARKLGFASDAAVLATPSHETVFTKKHKRAFLAYCD
jgi:hypothetical protein